MLSSYVNAPGPGDPVHSPGGEASVGDVIGGVLGLAAGPVVGKVCSFALGGIGKGLSKAAGATGRGIKKAASALKRSKSPATKGIPLGFKNARQFNSAMDRFRSAAGVDDALVGIRGSAVTGVRHGGGKFGAGSDFDFFIVSDTLFKQGLSAGARAANGALRVSATQRFFPGLSAVEKALSSELGRKSTIRIFSREGFNAVRTGSEIVR